MLPFQIPNKVTEMFCLDQDPQLTTNADFIHETHIGIQYPSLSDPPQTIQENFDAKHQIRRENSFHISIAYSTFDSPCLVRFDKTFIFNIKMVKNVRQIHRNVALMLSYHHLRSNIQGCFSLKFLGLSTGVTFLKIWGKRFRPFATFLNLLL